MAIIINSYLSNLYYIQYNEENIPFHTIISEDVKDLYIKTYYIKNMQTDLTKNIKNAKYFNIRNANIIYQRLIYPFKFLNQLPNKINPKKEIIIPIAKCNYDQYRIVIKLIRRKEIDYINFQNCEI